MAKFHTVVIDRKTDFHGMCRYGALVVHWYLFRFNPLRPPRGCSLVAWRNDFARIFSTLFEFMSRGHAVFLQGLHQTYQGFDCYRRWSHWDDRMIFPNFFDLLEVFKSPKFSRSIKGRGKESMFSIVEKIESLLLELGPVFKCEKGFDLIKLCKNREAVVLAVDGMSAEYQGFLVMILLLHFFHHFKSFGPRNELRVLFMFGEAKRLFGRIFENSFLLDLISQIRGLNIGVVAEDQIPAQLSQGLFSNVNNLAMFRHSDGRDLRVLKDSSGATYQQIQENYSLDTGDLLLRFQKSKDLLRLSTPRVDDEFMSRDEVNKVMKPHLERLYRDVIPSPRKGQRQSRRALDDVGKRMLKYLAGGGMLEGSTKVYEENGLSLGQGHKIKEELARQGYITEVRANLGKGGRQQVCLVPDAGLLKEFGIRFEGKGKALHQALQGMYAKTGEGLGCKAFIEHNPLGRGSEAADVCLEKDGSFTAVEVSVTSKARTEAENIRKNLGLGFHRIILTFVHRRTLEKARLLSQKSYSASVLEKVSFCLVGEFEKVMRGL